MLSQNNDRDPYYNEFTGTIEISATPNPKLLDRKGKPLKGAALQARLRRMNAESLHLNSLVAPLLSKEDEQTLLLSLQEEVARLRLEIQRIADRQRIRAALGESCAVILKGLLLAVALSTAMGILCFFVGGLPTETMMQLTGASVLCFWLYRHCKPAERE